MIYEHSDFRSYLKSVLVERIRKNPSYSLRALAKNLGLAPSSLSEVLKGRKNLSPSTAYSVAKRLELAGAEHDYFCLLVQFEGTKSPELRQSLQTKLQSLNPRHEIRDLSVDLFRIISEWYHFPILELCDLADSDGTPLELSARLASKKLGISVIEAEAAIERLERLELIEKDEKGRYRKTRENVLASSKLPDAGLRKFHRQMLEKATESLETQSPQEKVVGSETFAFSRKTLDAAKSKIDRFFDEMITLSRQEQKKTDVYHLGIQFFNLTPNKKDLRKERT